MYCSGITSAVCQWFHLKRSPPVFSFRVPSLFQREMEPRGCLLQLPGGVMWVPLQGQISSGCHSWFEPPYNTVSLTNLYLRILCYTCCMTPWLHLLFWCTLWTVSIESLQCFVGFYFCFFVCFVLFSLHKTSLCVLCSCSSPTVVQILYYQQRESCWQGF